MPDVYRGVFAVNETGNYFNSIPLARLNLSMSRVALDIVRL